MASMNNVVLASMTNVVLATINNGCAGQHEQG